MDEVRLITGTPGAGKTLNAIKMLHEDPLYKDRQVFYYNLRACTVPAWTELTEQEVHEWYELPSGCVIFVDEAQDIWRPMMAGKTIPESIKQLEKVRHRGINFIITCQYPMQLHTGVRALIAPHFHFFRPFGMDEVTRYIYQKMEEKPQAKQAVERAQVSRVELDSNYFDKYKSAEVHNIEEKQPLLYRLRHVPKILLLAMLLGFAYWFYLFSNNSSEVAESQSSKTQKESYNTVFNRQNDRSRSEALTAEQYVDARQPRVENDPKSAPIFDNIREVRSYPRQQCVLNHKSGRCQCYTQQGTKSSNVNRRTCIYYILNGFGFDQSLPDTAIQTLLRQEQGEDRESGTHLAHEAPIDYPLYSSKTPITIKRNLGSVPHPQGYSQAR